MMFWYGDAHWYFWQAALMWAGMVVFWAAVIWLVYSFLVRANRSGPAEDRGPGHGSARDILDQRFARGEIDEEEYHRRRDALEGRPLSGAGSSR